MKRNLQFNMQGKFRCRLNSAVQMKTTTGNNTNLTAGTETISV